MKPLHMTLAAAAAVAVVLALGVVTPALAQKTAKSDVKTPDGWSYRIENGRRVPKGNRVTAADGSWREEIRDGSCVTVKEKTASGEYREVRKCD